MEHCIASYAHSQKELAFKIYVTDALKCAVENIAGIAGHGSLISKRFADIIVLEEPEEEEVLDTKEKVVAKIRKKFDS